MGSGLSLLVERVGGLSPNEKRMMGEETCTESVEKRVGQKGSDCASSLQEEWREIQDSSITCGNYATSSTDFSKFQGIFSHRITCLPMMKYKAACSLARKGRVWADCPDTFSKDLLIKTLHCGSIFRGTS